jgi:hypothetical protein
MDYMTVKDAAIGYKVKEADVLQWISEGRIAAVKKDGITYISIEEYQRFGSSMPIELYEKIVEYIWEGIQSEFPKSQKEVYKRVLNNSQIVLDRDESVVALFEEIHKKYEPHIDIFSDKRGSVASFIIFARIISLLYSIINLLRNLVYSESFILFRPLWEAILLAEYFIVSEHNNENEKEITDWFCNDESPRPWKVRKYLSAKLAIPLDMYSKLYDGYSKPIHHTYKSIMDTYKQMSLHGPTKTYTKNLGFDYKESSYPSRDIVSTIEAFENLVLSSLFGFQICFFSTISESEREDILREISYYQKDYGERLAIVFGQSVK